MKANEIIVEGIWSDLRAAGRRNAAQSRADAGQWIKTQASRMVPQGVKSAYQSMQQYAQQAAQGPAAEQPAEPELTGFKIPKGRRLQVTDPKSKGRYFKNAFGVWTNEAGQRVRRRASINYLEKLATQTKPVFVPA
jgi:hypothetical protein